MSSNAASHRRLVSHGRLRLSGFLAAALMPALLAANARAADDRGWDFQPYRIHAILAVDAAGGESRQLAQELPQYLRRRVRAAIGPLWSFEIELARGTMRHRMLSHDEGADDVPPAELPPDRDKLLLLSVGRSPDGFQLRAREFDRYVERWGMPVHIECRQTQSLPEQLFALTWKTVAPLARFELDADDEKRVRLMPRGAAFFRQKTASTSLSAGDVFLPVLRRTARDGTVVENGIQVVPWTYLEVAEAGKLGDATTVAQIHSGNRRPFGVRRQGRVEQVAIGLRAPPGDTILRLHSRADADKPLVGYQVYSLDAVAGVSDPGYNDSVSLLGTTDHAGKIAVPPGDSQLRILYLKNGGQLLARLPFVPGAEPQIDVPLPDDDARLAAEARLAALREELIDVVAQRNILMARARQRIEHKDYDAAQSLLAQVDQLPGRSQFNLTLTTTARTLRSNDPQIQRRIDQLVEVTETVMNQYLDQQPINELKSELRSARN